MQVTDPLTGLRRSHPKAHLGNLVQVLLSLFSFRFFAGAPLWTQGPVLLQKVTEGHPAERRAPKLAPQNFLFIDFKP